MFDLYLTDTVTWVRDNGADQWGTPNAPTSTPTKARVAKKTRLVRSFDGEEVASDANVLLMAEPGHADRIILPGETRERAIVAIDEAKDLTARGYRAYLT